jgi:ADP-ribose pyrophosphatase
MTVLMGMDFAGSQYMQAGCRRQENGGFRRPASALELPRQFGPGGAGVATKKSAKTKTLGKVLSSKIVFSSRVFDVRRELVAEPQGVKATRDFIEHPGSVVVLPVFRDGRILLIRQYRHSAGQFLWELVAGRRDGDETFARGAHRELQEETGYTARSMQKLTALYPSPGFLREKMVIFLAQGLKAGPANPEVDEKIAARILSLRAALEWIRRGKICDGKTVAGILYYKRFILRK